MSSGRHEFPLKFVIIGFAVIAAGMLLLVNPFSSTPGRQNNAVPDKKPAGSSSVHDNDPESNDSGQGYSGYNSVEQDVDGASHVAQGAAVAGRGTNDAAIADLKERYQAILAIHSAKDRKEALLQFGRDLAKTDPAGGLALIKSLATEERGRGFGFGPFGDSDASLVCQGFFEAATQLDLNKAINMALELSRQFHRAGLGTVMKTWAGLDLNAALAYLGKLPPEYAMHGVESVFSVWGGKDPAAAMGEALKFKGPVAGHRYQSAVMSVIDGWSDVDPKAAWAYVMNPGEAAKDAFSRKDRYLSMIASKWAEKDFDAAMEAVRAASGYKGESAGATGAGNDASASSYQRMVEFMTMRLLETSPDAAGKLFDREKWLAGNPWLSTRNVTRLIDEGSVAEAAGWMANIPDKNAAFDCARQIAARRTRTDYDDVFKWANMIQDDYVRAGALSNVAFQQGQYDINRPIDWIYDLPAGYPKDRSVAGYVLGRIMQTSDRELEAALKTQMALPQIDMAGVALAVELSIIDPQEKIALMNLVEGRRPQKELVIK